METTSVTICSQVIQTQTRQTFAARAVPTPGFALLFYARKVGDSHWKGQKCCWAITSICLSQPSFLLTCAGGDTGSFVLGRSFSPGGLQVGMGIGSRAEMPHAEVILMHTNSCSRFPSLHRTDPCPALLQLKAKPVWATLIPSLSKTSCDGLCMSSPYIST